MDHNWPANKEDHVFGPWMQQTQRETRPILQYRICIHPDCTYYETREAPRG